MNQSHQTEQISTNQRLLADIAYCLPTLYLKHYIEKVEDIDTGPYDKALVIWGEILAEGWNAVSVGQWLVPEYVDKDYYSTKDPAAFLEACQRLIDAILPVFSEYYEEGNPFAGYLFFIAGEPATTEQKHSLIRRVGQGVEQLEQWIRYRRQTPAEQFLEMLSTIRIQITNDSTRDAPALNKQTVLVGNWQRDRLRLKDLARRFYQYIRSEKATENLRGIWVGLQRIKDVNLHLLLEKKELFEQLRDDTPARYLAQRKYNVEALLLDFPDIYFAGLEEERSVTNNVNKYFWGEIFHLLYARKEWAWQAYDALAIMLKEPVSDNPFPKIQQQDQPSIEIDEPNSVEEAVCTWKAGSTNFAELFSALIEAKAIECKNQEVGAIWLAGLLGHNLSRFNNTLGAIKNRSEKSRTAFLEKMIESLNAKFEQDEK